MLSISKSGAVALAAAGVLMLAAATPAANARQSDSAAQKPTTTKKSHKASSKSKISSTATTRSSSGKRSSRRKKSSRARGQQKIDSERARSIQEALIREHYLNGEPTGTWNPASEDAMRRYQADHGWQSKTVPDSRALISLGLGPSNDHLLNPESAMTTSPVAPKAASIPTTSQTPAPVSTPPAPEPADPPSPQ